MNKRIRNKINKKAWGFYQDFLKRNGLKDIYKEFDQVGRTNDMVAISRETLCSLGIDALGNKSLKLEMEMFYKRLSEQR